MAGSRQGHGTLHLEDRSEAEDAARRNFLALARNAWNKQGKKFEAERCSKGHEAKPFPAN